MSKDPTPGTPGTTPGGTSRIVAEHATDSNALAVFSLNLLGVFGPADDLRALVRMPSGKVRQVGAGQRLGLGRVVAIDAQGLMVTKNGRSERITMPGG